MAAAATERRAPAKHPVLRAFLSAPSGVFGLAIIFALLLLAIAGPIFFGDKALEPDFTAVRESPSWAHPLGTDTMGRDVLAQVLTATRLSLALALGAAAIAFVLGVTLGSTAAVAGPRLRAPLLRTIDVMLSFPALLTAIFVTVIVGRGGAGAMLGAGIAFSFSLARVSSTLALSVGGKEYVSAARVLGVSRGRLFLRYILPAIAEPLIIATSVMITASIVTVSALSFLGLGVQPPKFDWGGILVTGIRGIYETPAAALGPAAAIAISAIAFGFAGEALARAMNPRLWTTSKQDRKRKRAAALEAADAAKAHADAVTSAAAGNGAAHPELALDAEDLVVTFPRADGPVDVVKGASIRVARGEFIGIVGESGSGKTMTALAVAQLTPYPGRVGGRVRLFGEDVLRMPRRALDTLLGTKLAVVFQDPMSSLNPALRIGTQMTHGVRAHRKLSRKEARALAARALTDVSIPAAERQLSRFPHEFSGGMRQRAMIAMGLMKDPQLIVADEPTTALDVTVQAQVMDLLHEVNREHHAAILFISHNLALVAQNCHRVLVMYAGRIVEDLPASRLRTGARHPYTRALMEAVPHIGEHDRGATGIPGDVPDIGSPPSGCAFHPRCPLAVARCSREVPALLERPDGGRAACHVVEAETRAAGSAVGAADHQTEH